MTAIHRHAYGYQRHTSLDLTAATEAVTERLHEQGFGILVTIDVQATLRAKLGIERAPYAILGACNPPLAHQAGGRTRARPAAALPVVVYADGQGRAAVSTIDPIALFAVVGRAELAPVAEEVARRLQLALAGLPD